MSVKILVLVAAFNGERYIGEQLDSILGQRFSAPWKDAGMEPQIHIRVSDDCSADRTAAVVEGYVRQYPGRVSLCRRREPSGGAAAHFLSLLAEASMASEKPDYVMLSDQDDVWLPDKTQKLLEKMKELESRLESGTPVLVHSDLSVTDEKLRIIAPSFFAYQKVSPERTALPQLLVQNNVTGGAAMINRPFLELLKTPPEICLMHDAWIALLASCFGRIGWVDEPLYYYRQHGTNTLGAEKGDNAAEAVGRLKDGSKARENYVRMFGQARCLLELFGDRLDGRQRQVLEAFVRLPKQNRLMKMAEILRWGFTKNSWLRTLGQMLMIGD